MEKSKLLLEIESAMIELLMEIQAERIAGDEKDDPYRILSKYRDKIEDYINEYQKNKTVDPETAASYLTELNNFFNPSNDYMKKIIHYYSPDMIKNSEAAFDMLIDYLYNHIFSGSAKWGEFKGEDNWKRVVENYLKKRDEYASTSRNSSFKDYVIETIRKRIFDFSGSKPYRQFLSVGKRLSDPSGERSSAEEKISSKSEYEGLSPLEIKEHERVKKRIYAMEEDVLKYLLEIGKFDLAAVYEFKVFRNVSFNTAVKEIVDNGADYGRLNQLIQPILDMNLTPEIEKTIGAKYKALLTQDQYDEDKVKKTLCKYYINEVSKKLKRYFEGKDAHKWLRNIFIANDIFIVDESLSQIERDKKLNNEVGEFIKRVVGIKERTTEKDIEQRKEKKEKEQDALKRQRRMKQISKIDSGDWSTADFSSLYGDEEEDAEEVSKPKGIEGPAYQLPGESTEDFLTRMGLEDPDKPNKKRKPEDDDEFSLNEVSEMMSSEFMDDSFDNENYIDYVTRQNLKALENANSVNVLRMEIRKILNKNRNLL